MSIDKASAGRIAVGLAIMVLAVAVFLPRDGDSVEPPAAPIAEPPVPLDPPAFAQAAPEPATPVEGLAPVVPKPEREAPKEDPVAEETDPLLSDDQAEWLARHHWLDHVGEGLGVWVSVDEQRMRIIEDRTIIWDAVCATAANGTGAIAGSNCTPLGWHSVAEKFGEDAPWGQVFRARQATHEVWEPGDNTTEDLVLTRVLWLTGEEPGQNKGENVDSYLRYIYIHGTNQEDRLGTPSSHGCIRLSNDAVIEAFKIIPLDTQVLITERDTPQEAGES